ncbi:MAG: primosomal protein N' [Burkholderiales bacterium]
MAMDIARVALAVPVHTLFDYLAEDLAPADEGKRTLVPFGKGQRIGVIVEIASGSTLPRDKLKHVIQIYRDGGALDEATLKLLRFCSAYYHHPLGEVVVGAFPAALRSARSSAARPPTLFVITEAGLRARIEQLPGNAPLQRRVLQALQKVRQLDRAALAAIAVRAIDAARALGKSGWVQEVRAAAQPPAGVQAAQPLPLLNDVQGIALDAVLAQRDRFVPWLLFGVTGSGKTEVYLRVIQNVLNQGRQVLVLVPEISLTPQLGQRIQARFPGTDVAYLHSALSDGERLKNWVRAQRAEAAIVVGTRLAVFTPMPDLGLIVVDEENDASFKQQDGLRYSARDVALLRAQRSRIPIILGSATPSLESFYSAKKGRYRLLDLPRRAVQDATFPAVECIDIRAHALYEGLAEPVIALLRETLKRGEQSLVFVNRRGYAPVLACTQCTWCAACDRCTSKLVLHQNKQRMRCHHCGLESRIPRACPGCGNADLWALGHGTQRLESTLTRLFRGARILRIDLDTARPKGALQNMLALAHNDQADILVGTQLLAKGHDFKKLTLVVVVNGDDALYSPDFRASERLFAQLTQVAGRSGRAAHPGRVLIQTAFPSHPLFNALRLHDYAAFAEVLLDERRKAGFPPFRRQALLRAEAGDLESALRFLKRAAANAPRGDFPVTVYDPVEAPMARVAGRWRAQLLIQAASRRVLQSFLAQWLDSMARVDKVRWSLDVDPYTL